MYEGRHALPCLVAGFECPIRARDWGFVVHACARPFSSCTTTHSIRMGELNRPTVRPPVDGLSVPLRILVTSNRGAHRGDAIKPHSTGSGSGHPVGGFYPAAKLATKVI